MGDSGVGAEGEMNMIEISYDYLNNECLIINLIMLN